MRVRLLPPRTDTQRRRSLLNIEATEQEIRLALSIAYLTAAVVFFFEIIKGPTVLTPALAILLSIRVFGTKELRDRFVKISLRVGLAFFVLLAVVVGLILFFVTYGSLQ